MGGGESTRARASDAPTYTALPSSVLGAAGCSSALQAPPALLVVSLLLCVVDVLGCGSIATPPLTDPCSSAYLHCTSSPISFICNGRPPLYRSVQWHAPACVMTMTSRQATTVVPPVVVSRIPRIKSSFGMRCARDEGDKRERGTRQDRLLGGSY